MTLLERDPVSALERQCRSGFGRGRDFKPQTFDDLSRSRHLFGVRLREPPGAHPKGVLETDANVAAERDRLRRDDKLISAGAENGPMIILAE